MYSAKREEFLSSAKCLIETNKKYWGNDGTEIVEGEKWIYVLHTVHMSLSKCMAESIAAKALQRREKLPVASIISGRSDDLIDVVDQIDASFGIEQRFCPSYHSYDSEEIRTLAEKLASETYGKKDALLSLEYRGVRFGDVLYNEILRGGSAKNRGKIFDCFSINQEEYYGHVRDALAAIDQAYEIFEVRKPGYLIVTEYFYTKALYAYAAKALGAKIVIASGIRPDIAVQINSDSRQLSDVVFSAVIRSTDEKCLEYYQADDISSKNFFVMENGNKNKLEMPEAWKQRPNVFILPHAISDAPRLVCRHNFYRDYGEWFVETLKIVKDIPDVNWIIKDHPWSSVYGQEDYIRSVFEKYKTENMFWMDIEYSGLSIKDVADCVITCVGDAGIEYWAYGIPTITVGDAYYCNWGISYQMKTLAEYEKTLKNISNIPKPSKQSVEMAQKCIMARKNWGGHDVYSDLISELARKELSISKEHGMTYGDKDSADQLRKEVMRDFFEAFAALMKEQDLKESSIYQLKYLCTL